MKVSIITIVLNQKNFIESCINSIRTQTHTDIEHIIIDGGSTDGTKEIIEKYKNQIFRFVSEPDRGIYYAMNKGISMAGGDIIGFLNADDFYTNEGIIKSVVDVFRESNVDSCYGDINYVKRDDISVITRIWKSGDYSLNKFKKGWFPPHPTFFVKRDIYTKFGNFNTDFRFSADVELMIRFLCKYGISTEYIPRILIKMRDNGESNKNYINITKSVWECYKAMEYNSINVSMLYIIDTLLFRLRQKIAADNLK